MAIKGFDTNYFLTQAVAFGNAHPEYGAWISNSTTVEQLKTNLLASDYEGETLSEKAESLYLDEGVTYRISPNQYFDAGEYKASWIQKYSEGRNITEAQASAVFDAAVDSYNGDYYNHYLTAGASIGANPSNDFDESDYLQSLIDGLGINQLHLDENGDATIAATVEELRSFGVEYGYTVLNFYSDLSADDKAAYAPTATTGSEIVTGELSNPGQTYILEDTPQTTTGTQNDDIFVADDETLNPGDKINGGLGDDELKVSSDTAHNFAAFEMDNVETITSTADEGNAIVFDLSGTNDLELLRTLNSTGDVTYNEVTGLADIEVNNMTDEADLTVMFQDSAVAANNDSINLTFVNSINADIDAITIGSETVANDGIETINIEVDGKGAFTDIQNFNVEMETLNIKSGANDGDQDLIIRNVLSDDVRTVNATEFTADLTLDFSGAADVSYEGASGVDTIVFGGNGDNTINTYAGNDVVTLGLGDDDVDLGDGDDILNIGTNGLTVADEISGGIGTDTINLTGPDTIELSEAEQVTQIEVFNMPTTGTSRLVVSDNMVNTADNSLFTVNMGAGGNTVDISNVVFSNTAKIAINGTGGNDVVIADDATVNAKAAITFGAGNDTLRIMDGATITADDLAGITGFDVIELVSNSSNKQDWHFDAVAANIVVDADVQEGSAIYIDTTAGEAPMTVNSNTNMTVYVDDVVVPIGTTLKGVSVVSKLEFTENSDTLIGTNGNDTFIGESLDRFDIGDYVDAKAGTDTLQLYFQVNNPNQTLAAQLNQFTDNNTLEVISFITENPVSFSDISNIALSLEGVNVVNFGNGTSIVSAGATAATYNFGTANDRYTAAAAVRETLNGNAGDDTYNFGDITYYAAGDAFNGGAGADVINVTNNAAGLVQAVHDPAGLVAPTLSGIDRINLTVTTDAANGFTVSDTAVDQVDDDDVDNDGVNDLLTLTLSDANAVANTVAIFDARDVRMGNSVALTVTGLVDAQGFAAGNAANVVGNYVNTDVQGGAGNDTLVIGGGVEGYAVAGNAGADVIDISGAGENDAWVVYNSSNDGGNAGATTGYDTITGFVTGQDAVAFLNVNFGATDCAGTGAGADVVRQLDAPVNFTIAGNDNALVMTQIGTGMTDAELLDLNEVCINANVHGVTAAATNGGFIVAQGQTQSALYMYVESDGVANNVAVSELKMLALFADTNAFGNNASDMQYVANIIPGVNTAPVLDAVANVAFDEDTAVGTLIADLNATDAEGDALTYTIVDGNIGDAFAIDPATGEITLANALDFETLAAYTLTVIANDGTEDSAAITFDVTVNDVPEGPVAITEDVAAAGDYDAAANDVTFNFTNGNYIYNIAGFNDGDLLNVLDTAAITVSNTDGADGIIDISVADADAGTGTVMTIHLTGIVAADDASVFNPASFNAQFGAGALA